MRISIQKQKLRQQVKSTDSTTHCRAFPAQSHAVRSILQLQRTIGNHAVQRLLQNNTEELYEQQADRVADQVMRSAIIPPYTPPPPRPIAVRYGPEHLPFQDDDVYGIVFDIEVICSGCTAETGNLYLFEEREQLTDSFDHTGSFQQVRGGRSLPFGERASGWQRASMARPDRHGIPLSLIREAAEGGTGSFAIHQLDIYKRAGSPDDSAEVIPYSGYRVVYTVITNPPESTEGSIVLRVDKIPEACEVNGYNARAGSIDSEGTPSPTISGSIYVQGGGVFRREEPSGVP